MSKILWYAGIGCLAGAGLGVALVLSAPKKYKVDPVYPEGGGQPCPPSGARILLLGDSYAQGLTTGMTALAGGCNTPFVARGVVGSHVTEWASDGWLLPALAASTPNVVLVSLGANDFQRNDPSHVQAGVTALVAKIRTAGARVLWIAPLSEPFQDSVGALAMWKAAVGNDWFDSSLLTLPRASDGIHSTPAGYAAWAAEIWHWASGVVGAVALGEAPPWVEQVDRDVRNLMSGVTLPAGPAVPREWLKERLSFREAERRLDVKRKAFDSGKVLWHNPRCARKRGPSDWDRNWQDFKALFGPGDELWAYESEWGFLSGEAGYALVRDGQVVGKIITLMS